MSCYAAALTDEDVSNPSELNWYGIGIPWEIFHATDMLAKATVPSYTGVADWDSLYEMWLLDTSQDGSEHWGGDVDLDPEVVTGEETLVGAGEELLDSGPIGVYSWFKREILLRPYAAAGNAVIRFGDDFEARQTGFKNPGMGQVIMFGCVRHAVGDTQVDFNVEFDDVVSIEAMGLLMGGDYARINQMIQGNTAALGDFVRTVLFGGDSYIEASTMKEPSVKVYVKASIMIESPLQRQER